MPALVTAALASHVTAGAVLTLALPVLFMLVVVAWLVLYLPRMR
jgi:hypothetical protein